MRIIERKINSLMIKINHPNLELMACHFRLQVIPKGIFQTAHFAGFHLVGSLSVVVQKIVIVA